MKVSLSIIIPVYNTEKWLTECLESVVNQTEPFDEVILVDDGSTDGSLSICRKFVQKYSIAQLFEQKNQGPSKARNTGLQHVKQRYVAFLDSDDYISSDFCESVRLSLGKNDADILYFDAHSFLDGVSDPNFVDPYVRDPKITSPVTGMGWFHSTFPAAYQASACLGVYSMQFLRANQIDFKNGVLYEDNLFTFAALTKAGVVDYIHKDLYQRRYRPDSTMTGMMTENKTMNMLLVAKEIWTLMRSLGKEWNREKLFDYCCVLLLLSFDRMSALREKSSEYSAELTHNVAELADDFFRTIDCLSPKIDECDLETLVKYVRSISEIKTCAFIDEAILKEKEKLDRDEIVSRIRSQYNALFQKIPMSNPDLTIGIYGCGKHSEGMLTIYERRIGKIAANLIFIDTNPKSEFFCDRPVYSLKNVPENTDVVIISSFVYARDMETSVRREYPNMPIINIYKELTADVFADYEAVLEFF